MVQRVPSYFLAVHRQYAHAALTETRTVGFEVEGYSVLAGFELGAFPHRRGLMGA